MTATDESPFRCAASSWKGASNHPFGPGGYNRCVRSSDQPHDRHEDEWGNLFTINPETGKARTTGRVSR